MTTTSTTKDRLPRAPRLLIEVSDAEVEDAVRADSGLCMIAEAIKRQLPEEDRRTVTVDLQTIRFSDRKKGVRYWYLTPPVAQDALIRFDQEQPVEPIAFRLRNGNVARIVQRGGAPGATRQGRKEELLAKETAGSLTAPERRALTMMNNTDALGGHRAKAPGPRRAVQESGGGRGADVVIKGGVPPRSAALSNAKGRTRKYGLRSLKPPRVRDEGVGLVYAPSVEP